jgi:2-oxo-3-hexenedioate decarboxylase
MRSGDECEVLARAVAAELTEAHAAGSLIALPSSRYSAFDLRGGQRVRALLEEERRSRGAAPLGRKIGFTNREIWPLYQVDAPMWAHVWSASVLQARGGFARVSLTGLSQPRIEPEIAFRLAAPPAASDAPAAILAACDAYCHTIEIVQSHFRDWRFALADAAADLACHGRLVVGSWRTIHSAERESLAAALADGEVTLCRNGIAVAQGRGRNALGHPALALGRYLVDALAREASAPPLAAGEIVTTGTLTDAFPVAPGQRWTTLWRGLDVEGLTVVFED